MAVGYGDELITRYDFGREETFDIANDEQLIGCKFDEGSNYEGIDNYSCGVTWLKRKIFRI